MNLPSVIIIGGGISGLSAAYFLEQQARERGLQLKITLLEKSDRLGGVIRSEHVDLPTTGQRFLCEAGPDSLLTTKPAAIELCRELGIADQLIPSNDALRKTYVVHKGALRSLPDGLMFVVPTRIAPMFSSGLLSLGGKLRLLLSPMLSPGPLPRGADVSVDRYIAQRFGQEVSDLLAEPLLNAVYGADVRAMSARAVFPQLLALEEKHGSLWRAFARQAAGGGAVRPASHGAARSAQATAQASSSTLFVTLRDGLAQLPEKVRAALRNTELVCKDAATGIVVGDAKGTYRVLTERGARDCDAVIVAAPATEAGRLLESLDEQLAAELRSIVYHSVAIASLGYGAAPEAPCAPEWGRRGFGFVVPRGEACETIACTWVHNKFSHRAPPGAALVRSFFGGARNPAIDSVGEQAVAAAARAELRGIMGLHAEPDFQRVFRWSACMPQYSVGHLDLLAKIERRLAALPGVKLAGNGYRGVGIPDCVQSAREAAFGICDRWPEPS